MSNFLEHLKSKEEALEVLLEIYRVCVSRGGVLLILQPNIRYAYKQYWDFFDHRIPLSDKSLVEALKIPLAWQVMGKQAFVMARKHQ